MPKLERRCRRSFQRMYISVQITADVIGAREYHVTSAHEKTGKDSATVSAMKFKILATVCPFVKILFTVNTAPIMKKRKNGTHVRWLIYSSNICPGECSLMIFPPRYSM